MSNLRNFPSRDFHADPDSDHEVDQQAPEKPDIEKLRRLLGEMIESTAGAFQRPLREREVRIRNFRSPRLELADDLIVGLEEQNDYCVANSYDTGQYGYGFSPDDAIQHLCSVLEDYYDLLLEDEKHLSPRLESHLRYLRSVLRERK
ncbi:MAG: hypothetical protein WAM82_13075 [Thermoanaerobaculia bacterium]